MSNAVVDLTQSSPPPMAGPRAAHTDSVLMSAIDNAQPTRLRQTLQELCKTVPDAAKVTAALLLITEKRYKRKREESEDGDDNGSSEDDGEDEDDESGTDEVEEEANEDSDSSAAQHKHARSRYAMCENCEEEYDVAYNHKGDCVFHDGELEVDEDCFPDHDWRCHGPMDTPENRKDYPQSFVYTCCDQDGTSDGCQAGRHKELVNKKI